MPKEVGILIWGNLPKRSSKLY